MADDYPVTIITDLGYGDSGKGSVTDYLARSQDAKTVVRFNGGPQASHNVITPDGRHHAFHQFGSASFIPGIQTHLSRFMLVSPLLLWQEAEELVRKGISDAISQVSIDERALIISPYHEAANRIREALRENARHGSCGLGIGETMADSIAFPDEALTARDIADPTRARQILEMIRKRKLREFSPDFAFLKDRAEVRHEVETLQDTQLSEAVVDFYSQFCASVKIVGDDYLDTLLQQGPVLFEGAQGVLLDEWYGFHPHTTWSTTTNANADTLLEECGFAGPVTRLGLLRSYATRHGAGPFVTEDEDLSRVLTDPHNPYNPWQQGFRVGHFDFVTARYALDVVGNINGLVISHLDEICGWPHWSVCTAYEKEDRTCLTTLPRSVVPDLSHQGKLTEMLFKCQPRLEAFRKRPIERNDWEEYVAMIETSLGIKAVLTSAGPTASDKQTRS